jgi:acylphosphatase
VSADEIRRMIASGRVQGVGFRAFVAHEASRRNLRGWVRNRRDGTVEAVISGSPDGIATMIEACRAGPLGARVDGLVVLDADAEDLAIAQTSERFALLPTV